MGLPSRRSSSSDWTCRRLRGFTSSTTRTRVSQSVNRATQRRHLLTHRLTFVVVQLVSVPVHHVRLQEAHQSSRHEEAVGQGEAFDVAHVQRKGVGRGGNGAKTNQLTDHVPHADAWESNTKTRGHLFW